LCALRIFIKHPELGGFALVFPDLSPAAQAVQGNWNFFTIYRFGWSEKMVGISLQ